MKWILIVFLFSVTISAQNPTDKASALVTEFLNKSKDAKDIQTLLHILNKNQKRISSSFGNRFHPIDGKYKQHLGIDITAPAETPIHAAVNGTVLKTVTSNSGYGNQVVINH